VYNVALRYYYIYSSEVILVSLGKTEAPRVFISYSHDSIEHADRVLALANRFRGDGVDCLIDQFESMPEETRPLWTKHSIDEAAFILLVCTPAFRQNVEGHADLSHKINDLWSGYLVYQYIFNGAVQSKFIPVLLEGYDELSIPAPLAGNRSYHVENPEEYATLCWLLFSQPQANKSQDFGLTELPRLARQADFLERTFGSAKAELPGGQNPREGEAFLEDSKSRGNDDRQLHQALEIYDQANIYFDQGQFRQAEIYAKNALAIREKELGPEHSEVAVSLNQYAKILRQKKFNYKAAQLEARAKSILRKLKKQE
jgi:hypothetical protein